MTTKPADKPAPKKLTADERIDAIAKLLEANGITIPKALK